MKSKTKKVIVIIPSEKIALSEEEKLSVSSCRKFLSEFPITILLPDKFKNRTVPAEFADLKVEYFPSKFFKSTRTYSILLLSKEFYEHFSEYEYMLICQTDALVLKNELLYWCEKGHDYIGAPWFAGDQQDEKNKIVGVGNGGFSLRNIRSCLNTLNSNTISTYLPDLYALPAHFGLRNIAFLKILMHLAKKGIKLPYLRIFLSHFFMHRKPNEDLFWGALAKFFNPEFKVAPIEDALKFSFEVNPQRCYELNSKQLAFGCHAWAKWNKKFWENFITDFKNSQ